MIMTFKTEPNLALVAGGASTAELLKGSLTLGFKIACSRSGSPAMSMSRACIIVAVRGIWLPVDWLVRGSLVGMESGAFEGE